VGGLPSPGRSLAVLRNNKNNQEQTEISVCMRPQAQPDLKGSLDLKVATAPPVEPPAQGPEGTAFPRAPVYVLTALAVIAALYLGRAFLIPLCIGALVSYALAPIVDRLAVLHIPRALGAAFVVTALGAGLVWTVLAVSDDAALLIGKIPEAARKLRMHASNAAASPSALQKMQEAATELERAAATAAGAKPAARPVQAPADTGWVRQYVLAQSALLITVAAQAPIVLLLIYFLLASGGGNFRRRLLRLVGPSLERKAAALEILDELDVQVQRYLLAVVLTNVLIGVGTWLAFWALGLEEPGFWGIAAGVLHFIPYLGPALTALAVGIAAFVQFESIWTTLSVIGASLGVATVFGLVFQTWLQSRFAHVNAAILFIALLFFAWMWGAWGLLLGGPILAVIKVVCDRIESLRRIGAFLGK
jgi:predicted PurR-regulated permease PerM